jgi:hypothetical protein
VVTPWITVLGKGATTMPFVLVELRRVGRELRGAKVKVGWVCLTGHPIRTPDLLTCCYDYYSCTMSIRHILLP